MYRLARRGWVELLFELGQQATGGGQGAGDRSEL